MRQYKNNANDGLPPAAKLAVLIALTAVSWALLAAIITAVIYLLGAVL